MQNREEGAYGPILRAVRANLLLVITIVVVAGATAIVFEKTRPAKYNATAQILVSPVANEGTYAGLPAVITADSADPARTMQTATSVVESPSAALVTAQQLRGNWTQKNVGQAVAIQPRGESDIVSVTATANSALGAAKLANTYARTALSLHASLLSKEAKVQVRQLEEREKLLPAGENAAATQLAAQLNALSSVANGHDPNLSLLQAAPIPTAQAGSSKKLIVALALLAGLVIGVGAAVAIEYLNRRVRDEDELLAIYPLPVLTRVPSLPRGAREVGASELMPPRVREAFRTLQVQLPPGPGRSIMFTSASPRDGKTSSAVNFALVLAAADYRVILFDFDLRRPDVGRRLNVHADFMDLFRMDTTLEELLVEPRSAPGLRVISATPQNDVTPLLEAVGRRLPDLLRSARESADYVIIDTPPVGQVSDALRAAMIVDDIVLVSRPGNTDRTELQHTRELLDRMGHTPTGVVVIGEAGAGDAYATYGSDLIVEQPNGRVAPESPAPRARASGEREGRKGGEPRRGKKTKPVPYP
ncbi:MAG TPA: P-loop NTPase [Solirubrobacteraceae bacterium]|nr:P-loop NTPase [Solirubrobacteraceae bacterium]